MARDYDDVVVRYVDVDGDGVVDLDSLSDLLGDDTAVVSVMTANNETGVRQPLDGVSSRSTPTSRAARRAHRRRRRGAVAAPAHGDRDRGDMISICAHKIGGPVNAGALILRSDVALDAVVPGRGPGARTARRDRRRRRRRGTGRRGCARPRASSPRSTTASRTSRRAWRRAGLPARRARHGARGAAGARHGARDLRRPGQRRAAVPVGPRGRVRVGRAASCSSGAAEPSHVLAAMGVSPERARGVRCASRWAPRRPTTTSTRSSRSSRASSTGCAPGA